MKIAIVETSAFGGLLHYAVQLGDGLAERGHEVDVIAPRRNELEPHDGPARMRAVLAAPSRPSDALPASAARRFLKRAGVALRLSLAWAGVARAVWAGSYDVVLVNASIYNSVGAVGGLAVTLCRRGAKVVGIIHNARPLALRVHTGEEGVSPLTHIITTVISRYELVLVHGDRSKQEFEQAWPHKAVASIPHGDERVFAADPPPPGDEERILFFGDWNWAKGIPFLMDAFDDLLRRRPAAKLTIAGRPDPEQVDVEKIRAWARGHAGAVELIEGYVPMEDVEGLFARARVVVTPYIAGYQSGVVHLAMTMGRAVVASDVGDFRSVVIEGETGLTVPPEDSGALATALERVLADPELATRLGAAGRRRMEGDSSWEQVSERVEDVLTPILA